ncbi:Peptide-methionine (S)-S-oxide reductase [Aphelenchoides bicaudatus]|nr:Peptide-methionine (S)-S-oxide reductase [Aphelenchoides bicaudatus]
MLKRAYFGFQCFWGESSFAKINGVTNTRVGYAGGKQKNPTYDLVCQSNTDQTEIVEVEFDQQVISYASLVKYFFDHHDSTAPHKIQYRSVILYVDDEQKSVADEALEAVKKAKSNVQTRVEKFDVFWPAEDYHQKYWLRCQRHLFKELKLSDKEVASSLLATKLNAYMAGYDNYDLLKHLGQEHKLSDSFIEEVEQIARRGGDPRSCH